MFTILKKSQNARTGVLTIGTKKIQTPFFMPVATKGTIKCLTMSQLADTQTPCVIQNSLIHSLKPGVEVIENAGGLHAFQNWNGGIFTDSGGFQILLDEFFLKRTDDGIYFKNPFTGSKMLFTPQKSMHIQQALGSDVAMAFDDVARYGSSKELADKALEHSHEWAKICVKEHKLAPKKTNPHQLLFCIAHGNTFKDLREKSAHLLNTIDCDGYAIGGVAIGEPTEDLFMAIQTQTLILKEEKPKYVMGLGSPADIVKAVRLGCDIFDSIFPTQSARRGTLFTFQGPVRIKRKEYATDYTPIDSDCDCYTCRNHTKAYLHHLFKVYEQSAHTLATIHNIRFMKRLMDKIAHHIEQNTLTEFEEQMQKAYHREKRGGEYFQYNE
ncbi:MAG: tRNA guanosine(34) transglycosylase Tgt [Candidatus Woesearchaeota archaeon]